jgi:hypothetical protein
MRRAYTGTDFIKEDKRLLGVNLGFDFCAEHECGIKSLHEDFGMQLEEKLGFEARKNTQVPEGFMQYEKNTSALLYSPNLHRLGNAEEINRLLKGELSFRDYHKQEIVGAWNERSFGLHVISKHKDIIKMLYDAFQAKNGVIMLSGRSNPFANSGLMLLDYTKIPETTKINFREDDRKYREEQKMFRKLEKESGVFELLEKSGKKFIYLQIEQLDEKGKPRWWLNPWEQQKYNYGWYHTEDLNQWAKDKGPVVEKKK